MLGNSAGSCFPSLTCGHGGSGRDITVEIPDQTVRGVRPASVPDVMGRDGQEAFNIHKHKGQ